MTSVGDPFDENTFSDDGRIAYAEAQFDRVIRVSSYPDLIQRMKTRVATESLPQESVESGAAADVGR